MKTKAEIRKEVSARRKSLTSDFLIHSSREIVSRLSQIDSFRNAGTLALYKFFGGEVQLEELFPISWDAGKKTCIPVYNNSLRSYEMAEITSQTEFITGHYGILEPVSPSLVPISDIDLMTVPGIAFDAKGNRLGRGGGFYDRMLSGFRGVSAAVAFDFQIYDLVPTESHDFPVDTIISEIKVLNVQKEH